MPGNPVLGPIYIEELRGEDRKKAHDAVNLIKEKRHGKITTLSNNNR